jgi:hypothetical protein
MANDLENYNKLAFKVPVESGDYEYCSEYVTRSIEEIMKEAIEDE